MAQPRRRWRVSRITAIAHAIVKEALFPGGRRTDDVRNAVDILVIHVSLEKQRAVLATHVIAWTPSCDLLVLPCSYFVSRVTDDFPAQIHDRRRQKRPGRQFSGVTGIGGASRPLPERKQERPRSLQRSSSAHGRNGRDPAVDQEVCSDDVRGIVRREINRQLRDFRRISHPLAGIVGCKDALDRVALLFACEATEHRRVRRAWA